MYQKNYYTKYLKYRNKYLKLKQQYGGEDYLYSPFVGSALKAPREAGISIHPHQHPQTFKRENPYDYKLFIGHGTIDTTVMPFFDLPLGVAIIQFVFLEQTAFYSEDIIMLIKSFIFNNYYFFDEGNYGPNKTIACKELEYYINLLLIDAYKKHGFVFNYLNNSVNIHNTVSRNRDKLEKMTNLILSVKDSPCNILNTCGLFTSSQREPIDLQWRITPIVKLPETAADVGNELLKPDPTYSDHLMAAAEPIAYPFEVLPKKDISRQVAIMKLLEYRLSDLIKKERSGVYLIYSCKNIEPLPHGRRTVEHVPDTDGIMHLKISSYFDIPKFHDAETIETMRAISERSYFIRESPITERNEITLINNLRIGLVRGDKNIESILIDIMPERLKELLIQRYETINRPSIVLPRSI